MNTHWIANSGHAIEDVLDEECGTRMWYEVASVLQEMDHNNDGVAGLVLIIERMKIDEAHRRHGLGYHD